MHLHIKGLVVAALLSQGTLFGGEAGFPTAASSLLDEPDPALADSSSPAIQLVRDRNQVILIFTGTLESTEAINGSWTIVTNAVSPFETDLTALQKFYRVRTPESGNLFSLRSIVSWVVTGPLQTHFDLAFAGMPDGIFPPVREKPYFAGTLSMAGTEVAISLRVRGNSSLQECPFPKLKFKVAKEERKGTPFAEAREIKIGTHCAEGGEGTIGRLRDERATFREALAYEVMERLGFTGPRVRRARIEFRDTSAATTPSPTGWQVTRHALILEDPEVVAERLGGRVLSDEEVAHLEEAGFSEQLITDLHFLHILFGNWDYALSVDGRELWNTDVIQLADETYLPCAADFDLASWVTGYVVPTAPHDYYPELPELDRRGRFELEQLQKQVTPETFASARDRFVSGRPEIEWQVNSAEVDDAGRTNVLQHVTAFFSALEAIR